MRCFSSTTEACNRTSSTSLRMTKVPFSLGFCCGVERGGGAGVEPDGDWVGCDWAGCVWSDCDWTASDRSCEAFDSACPAKGCASTATTAQITHLGKRAILGARLFFGSVISGPGIHSEWRQSLLR